MPALIDSNNPYPTYAVMSPSAASSPRITSTGVPARAVGGAFFAPPTRPNNVMLANAGTEAANPHAKLKTIILVGIGAYLLMRSL